MKLLNKSIRSYLVYASIVLIISIPVFYIVIQRIVKEDVDESLLAHKEQVLHELQKKTPDQFLSSRLVFEPNLSIIAGSSFTRSDKFFSISIYDSLSDENIPYRVLESNVLISNKPFVITLKNSLVDSKDLIQSIFWVISILLFLIVAGLILINKALAKKIWNPFYSTLQKLHLLRIEDNKPVQFEKSSVDEFTDLNEAITSLATRSRKAYQLQKEFTENAAHEIQTPLAIFQHKLELLMQTDPLSAEQAGLISELADANQRMNRLNKSLLLLAKIEKDQFPEKEKTDLKELLEKLVEHFSLYAEKKGIRIRLDIKDNIQIEANRSLLEILFSNLLSNAIRHNHTNGMIEIVSGPHAITITNSGKPETLDPEKLFQRFQKQSTDYNSSGLGLAIAKKIADLYGMKLSYRYTHPVHEFNIALTQIIKS